MQYVISREAAIRLVELANKRSNFGMSSVYDFWLKKKNISVIN